MNDRSVFWHYNAAEPVRLQPVRDSQGTAILRNSRMALFISMFFFVWNPDIFPEFVSVSRTGRPESDVHPAVLHSFWHTFAGSETVVRNHWKSWNFSEWTAGYFCFLPGSFGSRREPMSCGSVSRHGEVAGRRGLSVRLLRLPSFCYSTCLFLKGFISDTRTGSRARKDGVVRSPFSISKDGSWWERWLRSERQPAPSDCFPIRSFRFSISACLPPWSWPESDSCIAGKDFATPDEIDA